MAISKSAKEILFSEMQYDILNYVICCDNEERAPVWVDKFLAVVLEPLTDNQRACWEMHFLKHLSQTEIAEYLGVSRKTVMSHIYRARRKVRKFYHYAVKQNKNRME